MERSLEVTEKTAERGSSNVLSFAVMVGLMTFFITGQLPGGLTSVQGYLVGFCAVIFLYVALAVMESRRSQPRESYKTHLNSPAGVSITQTENENGVTIQIHVNKSVALSRGTDNG
ncbi:MAG: hypothetical protein L0Y75_02800 [Acidobacteria bacterium]|nr:hypothetical protein [Acidobacteriota bacterium]